jgi:hypothetical protein
MKLLHALAKEFIKLDLAVGENNVLLTGDDTGVEKVDALLRCDLLESDPLVGVLDSFHVTDTILKSLVVAVIQPARFYLLFKISESL